MLRYDTGRIAYATNYKADWYSQFCLPHETKRNKNGKKREKNDGTINRAVKSS